MIEHSNFSHTRVLMVSPFRPAGPACLALKNVTSLGRCTSSRHEHCGLLRVLPWALRNMTPTDSPSRTVITYRQAEASHRATQGSRGFPSRVHQSAWVGRGTCVREGKHRSRMRGFGARIFFALKMMPNCPSRCTAVAEAQRGNGSVWRGHRRGPSGSGRQPHGRKSPGEDRSISSRQKRRRLPPQAARAGRSKQNRTWENYAPSEDVDRVDEFEATRRGSGPDLIRALNEVPSKEWFPCLMISGDPIAAKANLARCVRWDMAFSGLAADRSTSQVKVFGARAAYDAGPEVSQSVRTGEPWNL